MSPNISIPDIIPDLSLTEKTVRRVNSVVSDCKLYPWYRNSCHLDSYLVLELSAWQMELTRLGRNDFTSIESDLLDLLSGAPTIGFDVRDGGCEFCLRQDLVHLLQLGIAAHCRSWHALKQHDMACQAKPWRTVTWTVSYHVHAILCNAMHAVTCRDMEWHTMPCNDMYAMGWHATACHAMNNMA